MQKYKKLFKIHEKDNVAVALEMLEKDNAVELDGIFIKIYEHIDKGHKIAVKDIPKGEDIIKYGYPIGKATADIKAGQLVHKHNITTNLKGILDYTYSYSNPEALMASGLEQKQEAIFTGYAREDGSIGIRNEIWIINTVGCVNKTAEILAREATRIFNGQVDGIYSFPHPYGCSQVGEDHKTTQRLLAGLVRHPNAAGVLVLGLGCENNNIDEFKAVLKDYDRNRIKFLNTQDVSDEIEEGIKLIGGLAEHSKSYKRQEFPAARLVVGLKCGGSDAFSGITANPLVGMFSNKLTGLGGTTILTEVPEMFGAESILMNRCVDKETFGKTVGLINNFKEYYIKHNQEVYENPSPGNNKGGITTLEEKSLGCTQKAGDAPVVDVLDYGEQVKQTGLNLLKSPGNDMVACTALAASGAHLILFTTGRGTPLGAPVPTVKISTNTALYDRKTSWIDFDAGQLLEGREMNSLAEELFQYILKVASQTEITLNEKNGYREIAIFKEGVIL